MHNLCISFSKVPVELKFLITLTSMLKAEFLTVKEEERGRPDLQDPAQARGLAESATGSHNASLCLEAGEAKPASVAVLLNLGFPGSRSSGRRMRLCRAGCATSQAMAGRYRSGIPTQRVHEVSTREGPLLSAPQVPLISPGF